MATMVGAACFAVSGISETLGQEKEKSRPVYIATEEVAETTYMPEVEETTQPTETAKAVETEEPLIASMDWDKDDSYLLCKIAMAEAESEGVKGKALVMLVVLNRVWSDEFPDTIEEVIFQKNQFSPVANGRYDAVEPDEECYEALKLIQVDHWNERDIGYLDFVRYWGYDIQGAVYQEIVRQNTGEKLPFFIAGATKQTEPDIRIIHVTDNYLQEALHMVEMNMPRILRVKNGEVEPDRCELCDCCRHNRVLKKPISIMDLTAGI